MACRRTRVPPANIAERPPNWRRQLGTRGTTGRARAVDHDRDAQQGTHTRAHDAPTIGGAERERAEQA